MVEQVIVTSNDTQSIELQEDYKDQLDRVDLAKNFVFVLKSEKANVFSVNGGWGSGKTWFLKFVEDECDVPFIKFNVWENDYLNDPFRAIIAELTSLLERLAESKMTDPQLKTIKNEISEVKNFAEDIRRKCTFNAQVTTPSLGGTVPTASFAVSYDPSKIADYMELKEIKDNFIESLNHVLTEIQESQIIIALDELDRCRPDYAIRTLEVIKHFFHVKGIKFVLVVDKEQLQNTVKVLYGQRTDADCYLRKFVDVEYNLPVPSIVNVQNFINNFIINKYPRIREFLIKKNKEGNFLIREESGYFQLSSYDNENTYLREIEKYIITSIHNANLKLRDIEKVFLKLDIILGQFNQIEPFHFDFLWNLIIINTKYYNFFKMIEDDNITISVIQAFMRDNDTDNYCKTVLNNSALYSIILAVKEKNKLKDLVWKQKLSAHDYLIKDFSAELEKYIKAVNFAMNFE